MPWWRSQNATTYKCFAGEVVAMSVDKDRWHRLECLESGTVILECKDDPFEPIAPEDILSVE